MKKPPTHPRGLIWQQKLQKDDDKEATHGADINMVFVLLESFRALTDEEPVAKNGVELSTQPPSSLKS
jgi:hypothetical protein